MKLTIIIPTRDRSASVIECVHALEHNEAEIVIVDDGSEEPVVFPTGGVQVIRHNRHRGRSAAINTGLKAASHDAVLIIDDDIYAAPDMVVRLMNEFSTQNNPKIGLKPRVTWDPDASLSLTMAWMEAVQKFHSPVLLSKSFVLEHGGYDENLSHRLEDVELQLRLTEDGLEMRRLGSAVGFQNNFVRVRDLVEREFLEGVSAVFLHAKFPAFMPQVDRVDLLLKNEGRTIDAKNAVDEIALMEQSGCNELPEGASELYAQVARHYFMHGIFEGLKDIGGIRQRRNSSATLPIYKEASHLEDIAEFEEARRLFRLVLSRPDEQYWDGAEYHLGRIEMALNNPTAAYLHFTECLRLNPAHDKARRALYHPEHYREIEPNCFEGIESAGPASALFILFGDLGHIINAFPVVAALRNKFLGEVAWLTLPEYAGLARASMTGRVHETPSRGIIPWEWINAQGYTHVFFPEPAANHEEWEQSGLCAVDFMAKKCCVELETRRSRLKPGEDAVSQAEEFLARHALTPKTFITVSHADVESRHWPNSSVVKVARQAGLRAVVFSKKGDIEIPNTITCPDMPLDVIAVLIASSCFYLGPAYGISWLATTTDTPMAVFFDPLESGGGALCETLRGEKDDIREWSIYTNLQTVLAYMESTGIGLNRPPRTPRTATSLMRLDQSPAGAPVMHSLWPINQ